MWTTGKGVRVVTFYFKSDSVTKPWRIPRVIILIILVTIELHARAEYKTKCSMGRQKGGGY